MENFSSQRIIEIAAEERSADFPTKQVQLQRRNHRFTGVNCSKTVLRSALLTEKPWINLDIPQHV